METSIRIIDYHLKERIEGQNSKITLSGRNLRGRVKEETGIKSSTQKSLLPLIFAYFIVNRTTKNPGFNLSFLS